MSEDATALATELWIDGAPETVFDYLTDPRLHMQWMGREAELDVRPGGQFRIVLNDAVTAVGEYLLVEKPRRLVYTWGWLDSEDVPPGSSRVEFVLTAENGGTHLRLSHTGLAAPHIRLQAPDVWQAYLAKLAAVHGA